MSAPPSPYIGLATSDKEVIRKRDRPPTLAIVLSDSKAVSDGEVRYDHPSGNHDNDARQPQFRVSPAEESQYPATESESEIPRSASATSSLALDPYYFGMPSREHSPALHNIHTTQVSTTPDTRQISEPVTPARDPARIDRKGLIGVGELATPRWIRAPRYDQDEDEIDDEEGGDDDDVNDDDGDELLMAEIENDGPDSPWTIEAVNSGSDDKDEPTEVRPVVRTIRTRPSMAEESGGEEILYPRNVHTSDLSKQSAPSEPLSAHEESPLPSPSSELPPIESEPTLQTSPPSAFAQLRTAKKRTSDEFEFDNVGMLITKGSGTFGGSKEKVKGERTSARRHRSLGVGVPSSIATPRDKGKERQRDTVGLSPGATPKANTAGRIDRHLRQTSASSSSSAHADALAATRRVHTTDFSHLPPSPSSSSIQQFLHHAANNTMPLRPSSRDASTHASATVAHSLLRGSQEGWSSMDDEATAEALRKLDGLSGKGARARASVGSVSRSTSQSRPASLSRPGTPAKSNSGIQWEGIEGGKATRKGSAHTRESILVKKDKDSKELHSSPVGLGLTTDLTLEVDTTGSAIISSDDQQPLNPSAAPDKTPKKSGTTSTRSSFTPKRGSASSTNYTSTPTTTSSRDSAQLSSATSATSGSAPSGRYSTSKNKRNSAGSDISNAYSSDATSFRGVVLLSASGDIPEDQTVPPVPPLPKDLSNYKSPPQSSAGLSFPSLGEDSKGGNGENDLDRTISLEVPNRRNSSSKPSSSFAHGSYLQTQQYSPSLSNLSTLDAGSAVIRTPSKKWSFSNALNKLSSSPSSASLKDSPGLKSSGFPLSPRSVTFGQRKSITKDRAPSPSNASAKQSWSPIQADAMASAASLASLSSIGSIKSPIYPSKTPDRLPSRSGTESSASNHTTSALAVPQQVPLSPTSSVRRGQSHKRLTPSSIPFFRRSSSQSMHIPASSTLPMSSSPTLSAQSRVKASSSPSKDANSPSHSTPASAQKKSSVLSLGLPSLLKGSSSRRSLHAEKSDSKDSSNENKRTKDAERLAKEAAKLQKERQKKEDKDRSESRISVMMGRKRGKTLSSTDPKKIKPVELPPIQMSAIAPATAQRVASLKPSLSNSSLSTPNAPTRTTSTSSRLTAQTASSLQKQSDTSLRGRNQLPTIAGSPSTGSINSHTSREPKELPPSTLLNLLSSNTKETPTRIPRISSRTSALGSPTLKNSTSALADRRASLNVGSVVTHSTDPSPTPGETSINEFGVLENGDKTTSKLIISTQRQSVRGSPSSRVPRQVSVTSSGAPTPRKSNRDSVSFGGLRKASVGSVASTSSVAPSESHHRFSALSPSKGFKLLTPKMSLPTTRSSVSQSVQQGSNNSPSSSRQSLSTPSPAPSSIDEEELLGDEEMMQYIRRQQTKKMASGASQKELDELLSFPDPLPPTSPSSPEAILKSNQVQHLSHYERKEILDFPSVYYFGGRSKKKLATPDNSTNNFGYDDERGDYLVINHDHLAYRYEVIDTLGKGSFGQVLHCRDHCTGDSVAIKIIRNKKRFHHQALVEIKILDNLRKWDHEEKHHVIKMTEHFYFRSHLCIAMELLSINLYELIKANGFVGFTTALIRRFTSQMLSSLQLMRHHRIVHCDLKPENVLLRHPAKSAIKVIDFGSSCFEHEKIYTYIQSRFYRSPEVILGMNYHMAIDIWSLGCILAELYTGFPIFPGENEQEQLACIMEVLGLPDKDFINKSSRKRIFFDNHGGPRPVVNSKGRRRRPGTKSLAQVLRCNDEEFVDFISKCLTWDPEKRIKPQGAMRHPFITGSRRAKVISPSPAKTLLSSSGLTSRAKQVIETPKKSQISAPTPLTARSSRTTANVVPSTPSSSSMHSTVGSSSRYRSSQSQSLSSTHFSSRTLNGYASTASTK